MAFTAKLISAERSDQTQNVEILFEDSVTGFSIRRVFNFPEGVTVEQVRAEAIRVGEIYKTAQATETTLKGAIGTTITI